MNAGKYLFRRICISTMIGWDCNVFLSVLVLIFTEVSMVIKYSHVNVN